MAKEALVQGLCMLASTSQPGGDGGLSIAEDPLGCRRVQSFGQRRKDHSDLVRGSFQTIQRRVAPGSERAVARLAAKGLDPLGPTMPAVPDKRMEVSVSDPAVRALRVRTGEAVGVHALGCSSAAFHLTPRPHWHRGRFHTWRAEATDGTIKRGAWPEKTVEHRASAPFL